MSPTTPSTVLDRILQPVTNCFSPQGAKQIANLQADEATQARIDVLAAKANEGELTDAERKEYSAYVEAINFLGVLQAKARRFLANHAGA